MRFSIYHIFAFTGATAFLFYSISRGAFFYGETGVIVFAAVAIVILAAVSLAAIRWKHSNTTQQVILSLVFLISIAFLFNPHLIVDKHELLKRNARIERKVRRIKQILADDDRFSQIELSYCRFFHDDGSSHYETLFVTGEVANVDIDELRRRITGKPSLLNLKIASNDYCFVTWNIQVTDAKQQSTGSIDPASGFD
ncbi:hypothetical protein [Novipirellula rosea]|uniref:hypothetical protein n=1 Tax=Novipirellula rosea TaxID=1031540 RepID=UPI0031E9E5E1